MNSILDIFYNEIIPEAASGKVSCYFTYNILFNTIIENKKIKTVNTEWDRILTPTLTIKNKIQFDELLLKYVSLAYDFYKESYYNKLELNNNDKEKIYIKSIMALLWSNATGEDYANPCRFIQKRIDFIKDTVLLETPIKSFETSIGTLRVEVEKEQLYNETPYCIKFIIDDYPLPVVRCGISENRGYIYSIQNTKLPRNKKLNRDLYKVNEGIDLKAEESDNIEHPENLKGITPATLLSASLIISFLKSKGINEIIVPCLLLTRWNAKEIITSRIRDNMIENKDPNDIINNKIQELNQKNDEIQRNLSDKFIRTFRRIEYHFSNIKITAFPFIRDIDMHLEVGDEMQCNNPLLKEMYEYFNANELKR